MLSDENEILTAALRIIASTEIGFLKNVSASLTLRRNIAMIALSGRRVRLEHNGARKVVVYDPLPKTPLFVPDDRILDEGDL